MQRYKLTLEYDGTDFGGFQSQKNTRTVQDVLEETLQKIYKEKIRITGSSRTDSGVHAEGQAAHYDTEKIIPTANLIRALNSNLPDDVAVTRVEKVSQDFHARFSAKKKAYLYQVILSKIPSPLERRRVYFYYIPINIAKIKQAARLLVGTHDFKSFQARSAEKEMSTVRTLTKVQVIRKGERLDFFFEGNGFLYNMVRNIVGTLLEVGRGRMSLEEFKHAFKARDRRLMGPTAPPQGLTLKKINF